MVEQGPRNGDGRRVSNLTKAEFIRNGSDVHLYIATPATSIASNFHVSLIREIPRLLGAGMSVTYAHLAGHCHVDDARNLLAVDFLLKSDATDILWWDSDVAAEPGAALKLLAHPGDIVGGAYPLKDDSQRFPVRLVQPMAALCPEAEMLPTGFLLVRRHVMDDLAKRAETLNMDGQIVPIIFERGSFEGQRVGGDANFCRKATAAGFKLYCDPTIIFTHQGPVDFAGRLADHLGAKE